MLALGIDIGSTATKVVLINERKEIIDRVGFSLGAGTSGADRALAEAFERNDIDWSSIDHCVVTGYGRQRFQKANKEISEISCHAKCMSYLLPGTRTIIDIGGQDAKALKLRPDGTLDNFIMNEKCAAGTGRFLDVMARVLDTDISKLGDLDKQSNCVVEISSTCTVFAESEVISHLSNGEPIPDIVAGIHCSVARRVSGLVKRLGSIDEPVAMSGGVALNNGVVRALEKELGIMINVSEDCQFCGALGAALYAMEKIS